MCTIFCESSNSRAQGSRAATLAKPAGIGLQNLLCNLLGQSVLKLCYLTIFGVIQVQTSFKYHSRKRSATSATRSSSRTRRPTSPPRRRTTELQTDSSDQTWDLRCLPVADQALLCHLRTITNLASKFPSLHVITSMRSCEPKPREGEEKEVRADT